MGLAHHQHPTTDVEPTCTTTTAPRPRTPSTREAELPTTKWEEEIARGLELRPARRGLHRGPAHPDVLPRRAAALRRHQHLPQGAVRRGRAPLRRVRRGRARRAVRRRHHLPLRHPVRPAGHPQDLRALRPVLLRTRRRPARVDHDRRPGRHLHHPGQHREDLRPDLQGGRPRLRAPGRSRWCSAATTRSATPPCAAWPSTCDGNLGIIHFDRHVDTQETDLDERMHTTPWFHATDIPNVPPKNLVQIGIGGWQAPRPGRQGRPRARHHHHDRHRLRRDGHRGGRRAGPRGGLGRRRGGLAVLRRGLPGRRVRARHRLARAGRLPAPRGAQVHPAHRRAAAGRHRGRRVLAAVRQRRDHRR